MSVNMLLQIQVSLRFKHLYYKCVSAPAFSVLHLLETLAVLGCSKPGLLIPFRWEPWCQRQLVCVVCAVPCVLYKVQNKFRKVF